MITITDRLFNKVAQFTADVPTSAVFYNDVFTQDLKTGISSYEFMIDKNNDEIDVIKVGYYVLANDGGKVRTFQILSIDEDNETKEIYAEDGGLDLIANFVGDYRTEQGQTLRKYCDDFLDGTGWEIGVDESHGRLLKLSWEGTTTTVKRLKQLANRFDLEVNYDIELRGDKPYRKLVNFYEKIGKQTPVNLVYGQQVSKIQKTEDISNLATAITSIGKDGLTLDGYKYTDPINRYELRGATLCDKESARVWTRFGSPELTFINKLYESEAQTQKTLFDATMNQLKKAVIPSVTYKVDFDLVPDTINIGDVVLVHDRDYQPAITLQARVNKIERSFTFKDKGKVTLTNIEELEGLEERLIDFSEAIKNKTDGLEDKIEDVDNKVDTEVDNVNNSIQDIDVILKNKVDRDSLNDLRGEFANLEAGYEELKKYGRDLSDLDERLSSIELSQTETEIVVNSISSVFTINENGLLIGKNGSNLQTLQTNDRLSFLDGGKEVAYISGQKMTILSAEFIQSVIIANHIFEKLEDKTVINYIGGE